MAEYGNGSKYSPIVISDDEGVSQMQLEYPSPTESEYDVHPTPALPQGPKGMKMMLNMGYTPGLGLGYELDGQTEPVPVVLKRKRDEGGVGSSGTSTAIFDEAFVVPESKKARKRRRKLEREILERAQTQQREQGRKLHQGKSRPYDLKTKARPTPSNLPIPPLDPRLPGTSSRVNLQQLPRPPDSRLLPLSQHASLPPFPASSQSLNYHHTVKHDLRASMMSLPPMHSIKQNMNTGGGLPTRPLGYASSEPSPSFYSLPPRPSNLPPLPPPSPSVLPKPISSTAASLLLRPPPPKKPLPIGMHHGSNPNNSHGIFHCFQHPDGDTYIPNPARTLVMEQLPKNKRHREFLITWCKNVCGTRPVHLELDNKGKALIEFGSAEMARAAFSAPRFSNNQGKGAIRAWWYRVDRIASGSGVGEVEEGEIEDDDENVRQSAKKGKRNAMKNKKKKQAREAEAELRGRLQAGSSGHDVQFDFQPQTAVDQPPQPVTPPTPPLNGLSHSECPSPVEDHSQSSWIWGNEPVEKASENSCYTHDESVVPSQPDEHREDDDRSSIASSRPGTPSVEACACPKEESIDRCLEDKEVDLPARAHEHVNGSQQQLNGGSTEATVSPVEDTFPAVAPSPPAPQPADPPQLPDPDAIQSLTLDSASPSTHSGSSMSTPTPPPPGAPCEPHTIKNTPTGPSFTKRLLLARQKELQERIARSKLELSMAGTGQSSMDIDSSEVASTGRLALVSMEVDKELSREAVEDNLRRLVLNSKRNKAAKLRSNIDPTESDSEVTSLSLRDSYYSTSNTSLISRESASPVPPPVVVESPMLTPNQETLDELAVSFITEAIQTVKSQAPKPAPPPPASVVKLELAAKQQRLEQHIAESKLLMAKLNSAQTKQERDDILSVMRERSRMMEADMKQSPATSATTTKSFSDYPSVHVQAAPTRFRWPETRHAVLVVSDDDDDEDDDEDGEI